MQNKKKKVGAIQSEKRVYLRNAIKVWIKTQLRNNSLVQQRQTTSSKAAVKKKKGMKELGRQCSG